LILIIVQNPLMHHVDNV